VNFFTAEAQRAQRYAEKNTVSRMNFFKKDNRTAFEAKEEALWIAFGPVIFQAARVLRNNGILQLIEDSGSNGITINEIVEKLKISLYGVKVLIESGLSMGLIIVDEKKYRITKTGSFILHDELTKVNMDFVHDVCYKGLFELDKSIETGKPAGLKEFGEWPNIYEGISQLPPHVQKSWFSFDHYFSDDAFPLVAPKVLNKGIKNLLDIGGNTGKWAITCMGFDPEIKVTIMDLPGQLNVARTKITNLNLTDRVSFYPINILDEKQKFPEGHDAIWMSQFLDCFSEEEIVSILKRCHAVLDDDGHIFILEPYWDKQRFEIAAFCLHQTSLYFTALANGTSRMYDCETFVDCINKAGFEIVEQVDNIGLSQTLMKCKKRK
jgi:ubiquinone/menaquinone biosynthesis C-methylase UbiE